jgi:YidC/Oxa1 family membrane protein insertase
MKKNDIIPLVILLAAFLAWPFIDRTVMVKFFPPKPRPAATRPADAPETAMPEESPAEAPAEAPAASPAEPAPAPVLAESVPDRPEVENELTNSVVRLVLTSRGGGVKSAEMLAYPLTGDPGSGPVRFDFSDRPAGGVSGYGLPPDAPLEQVAASADAVEYRFVRPDGAVFRRRIALGEAYTLRIEDSLENATSAPVEVAAGLQCGWMPNLPGDKNDRMPTLGIDTLVGQKVENWSTKLERWFPSMAPGTQYAVVPGPGKPAAKADWVAVKDKYFVQILTPANDVAADQVEALARRGEPQQTRFMLLFPRTVVPLDAVSASLRLPAVTVPAGETLLTPSTLYLGPKLYATLKANGPHQEDILELGFFSPIGRLILRLMVWMKEHVWPFNYGLAIILLTLLIRGVFWPLNRKSMLSTRRMQEIQPLITATREKYKGDPQKQQQAMMQIYREHKINPMGGCLPMLVQIPVFFALFVVLRGAIELRFSRFLWIADLSTPENLFASVLPVPVNILPIFMGVTMWIQQKMTPTSDPQQQKMMMMMPVLFTVLFYNFPSGLSLYWTTNQILMIIQLAAMRRKPAAASPAAKAR